MTTLQAEIKVGGKRRQYGKGTVRKRGDSWQISYYPRPGGKRVWETVGKESAGVTREAAEHLLMERLVAIGRGQGDQYLGTPFEQAASEWRRNAATLSGLSPRAIELMNVALDCHLIPAFGDDYLHQIRPGDIERYAAQKMSIAPGQPGAVPVEGAIASKRKTPLGMRSIEQQISVLNRIFRWAKRDGLVSENPVDLIELSRNKRTKKRIIPMEQTQVKQLLQHSGDEENETMILTMAALGLRIGELLALDVSDLNPSENSVTVARTLSTEGGKTVVVPYPKTDSGFRVLKVSQLLFMRLERQVARAKEVHKTGHRKFLFPSRRGTVRNEGNWRRDVWRPSLDAAGIPRTFTPHSLRHTFASEMIAKNTPITQVSWLMGHASPATTMSVYASVIKRHESEQADIADLYA